MSFNYNSYAKDLNELLQSPGTWLAKQKVILKELNLDIIEHNKLYNSLTPQKQDECDSKYPNCRGELRELNSMNDADLLLFAIFGPMHILNPNQRINKLKECLKKKIDCLEEASTGLASSSGTTSSSGLASSSGTTSSSGLVPSGLVPSGLATSSEPSTIHFVEILSNVNEYINSFNLNLLLTPPFYMRPKESFLQSKEYILNDNNKLFNLTKNDALGQIFESENILENTKSIGASDFDQKKKFYDLMTDLVSKEEVFTDSKQLNIFYFQSLVNNFFNKFVKEYLQQKGLPEDFIVFIYKGGTSLKIIYEKYRKLLGKEETLLSSTILESQDSNKLDFLNNYFKRSDSDYAIYINKDTKSQDKYFEYFYDMNILTTNILNKIKNFLSSSPNREYFLPLSLVTEEKLKNKLAEANKILIDNKAILSFFSNVEKFVGITFNNVTYMEPLPNSFDTYNIEKDNEEKSNNRGGDYGKEYDSNQTGGSLNLEKESCEGLIFKNNSLQKTKKASAIRCDFYVTYEKRGNTFIPKIVSLSTLKNTDNGIYYYLNETNRYIEFNAKYTSYFNLHRVKINSIFYMKTKDNKYGIFEVPSELIDIPISHFIDYKIRELNLAHDIKKYSFLYENHKMFFNSYTVYGFLYDLQNQLFVEAEFPWKAAKYDKKINRMIFMYFVYFYNNFSNYNEILLNGIELLNAKNIVIEGKIRNSNEIRNISNEVILNNFYKICHDYNNGTPESLKYIETLRNSLEKFTNIKVNDNIKTDYAISGEEVPFLQKYLKYKHKYMMLKNKKY